MHQTTDAFYEVTGYFIAVNILGSQWNGAVRDLSITVDGSVTNANFQEMSASIRSPLADHDNNNGRFVDAPSVFSVATGLTLGIHTIKIAPQSSSDYADLFGIELIAQNTTSTANRSKIQIPSQDVVSYGKKFAVSGTPHYNPFNNQAIGNTTSHGKNTTGWTAYDSTLDTATSLGLSAWVDSGNYYRPVNGGRIVKWVDSSGNIKTSVNMMPPAARHISGGGNNGLPTGTSWLTVSYTHLTLPTTPYV